MEVVGWVQGSPGPDLTRKKLEYRPEIKFYVHAFCATMLVVYFVCTILVIVIWVYCPCQWCVFNNNILIRGGGSVGGWCELYPVFLFLKFSEPSKYPKACRKADVLMVKHPGYQNEHPCYCTAVVVSAMWSTFRCQESLQYFNSLWHTTYTAYNSQCKSWHFHNAISSPVLRNTQSFLHFTTM